MVEKKKKLDVNDLLDLYLLAEKLGDTKWQEELLEKLQKSDQETEEDHELKIHNLWLEYKNINNEILSLYDRLKAESTDEDIFGKINALKEKRLSLTHKIHLEERKVKQLSQ
jgi:hypothetical protein